MPKPNWAHLNYLSAAKVDLAIETSKHPELIGIIIDQPDVSFETRLGHVAAYCEVALDGAYSPDDLDRLCNMLTEKLRQKRSSIVLPTGGLH